MLMIGIQEEDKFDTCDSAAEAELKQTKQNIEWKYFRIVVE